MNDFRHSVSLSHQQLTSIPICSNSRRTSTDSLDSAHSSAKSPQTATTNGSCYSTPSSPYNSETIYDNSEWYLDESYTIDNTLSNNFLATVWKKNRSAPLPLPQHEPRRSHISISETSYSFEIRIELPQFSPDSITVAQRREDHSIHIVADQVHGENSGHYERLIRLYGVNGYESSPSKQVSSKFDESNSTLSVSVIKLSHSTRKHHAVVCDDGSGLTGNKTYRIFF